MNCYKDSTPASTAYLGEFFFWGGGVEILMFQGLWQPVSRLTVTCPSVELLEMRGATQKFGEFEFPVVIEEIYSQALVKISAKKIKRV
jgi:hypothetical protein